MTTRTRLATWDPAGGGEQGGQGGGVLHLRGVGIAQYSREWCDRFGRSERSSSETLGRLDGDSKDGGAGGGSGGSILLRSLARF